MLLKLYIITIIVVVPSTLYAEGLIRLSGLPGSAATDLSTAGYINALYILSISVAAFLAVARIILAGVQYMLSDVVTDKGSAKKQITGALLGLLIVISAVLVLETINPRLTNWNVLDRIEPIESGGGGGGTNTSGSSPGSVTTIVNTLSEAQNLAEACGGTTQQLERDANGPHRVTCPAGSISRPKTVIGDTFKVEDSDSDVGDGPLHNQNVVFSEYDVDAVTKIVTGIIDSNGNIIGCGLLSPTPSECGTVIE